MPQTLTIDQLLELYACADLGIPTLQTRGRDGLDFHDVGVAALRICLRHAYELGKRDGKLEQLTEDNNRLSAILGK